MVSWLTVVRPPRAVAAWLREKPEPIRSSWLLGERQDRRRAGCHRQPEQQRGQRPHRQIAVATDDADPDRRDRQQVGAHGHRADDEDGVELEHAVAGDDAGGEHEHEVAPKRACVVPGGRKDVGPHQARLGRRVHLTHHLESRQSHRGVGDAEQVRAPRGPHRL